MSIFKQTFPDFVQEELKRRQDLLEGKGPLRNELVNQLTTRNAWVRMTSGVNVVNKEGNYDNSLAKQYVLLGGTLNKTSTTAFSVDGVTTTTDKFNQRSGVGSSFDNAYSNTSALGEKYLRGIRPMPGITNLSTVTKAAYGSLIEATINFSCWDIKQLEDLELLFMRPGYTVLVEWGWVYSKQQPFFYDILNKGNIDFQQVNKELFDLSKENKGNYEAVLGYVKNYNWKTRSDGGYDCTTQIISFGEVLESIKVNYSPYNIDIFSQQEAGLLKKGTYQIVSGSSSSASSLSTQTVYTLNNSAKTTQITPQTLQDNYSKGILHGLTYEMRVLVDQMPDIKELQKDSANSYEYPPLEITAPDGTKQTYNVFKKEWEYKQTPEEEKYNSDNGFSSYRHYITLESLCTLINNYVLLKNTDSNATTGSLITKVSTKDREYVGYRGGLTCLAHPLQISTDFTKCLIKGDYWINGNRSINQSIEDALNSPPVGPINPILERLISSPNPNTLIGAVVSIGNASFGGVKNSITLESTIRELKKQLENSIYSINKSGGTGEGTVYNFSNDGTSRGRNWGNITNQTALKNGDQEGLNLLALINSSSNQLYQSIKKIFEDDNENGKINLNTGLPRGVQAYPSDIKNFFLQSSNKKIIEDLFQKELSFAPLREPHSVFLLQTYRGTRLQEASKAATEALKGLNILRPYFDSNDRLGYISNIYVDLGYLMEVVSNPNVEARDTQNKNTISLINFFKEILRTIQQCTGNVNNFDLHIDKDGVGRIIDINFTDDDNLSKDREKIFQIEIHNLKSSIRNYQLESKIFPEQGTIVAISAQAEVPGKLGYNNSTLVAYNRGIQDRLMPKKSSVSDSLASSVDVGALFVKNFTQIQKYFDFINNPTSTNNQYAPGSYNNALRDLIGLFSQIADSNPNQFKAIIPVMLSFDMDGIGGIIIGNIFKINDDVLPNGYKSTIGRKLGFLVKSFNHKIESSDWITTIEAYPVILEDEINTTEYWNKFFKEGLSAVFSVSSGLASVARTNASKISSFGKVSSTIPLGARPLLDTIAYTEGTAGVGQNGYDILVGFNRINNWNPNYTSPHPNVAVYIPNIKDDSTAAGRYQFLKSTWDSYANKLSFNKENQDKIGWELIKSKRKYLSPSATQAFTIAKEQIASNKIDVYKNTAFLEFLNKTYQEWASLPNAQNEAAYFNQGGQYSVAYVYNVYIEAVKKY